MSGDVGCRRLGKRWGLSAVAAALLALASCAIAEPMADGSVAVSAVSSVSEPAAVALQEAQLPAAALGERLAALSQRLGSRLSIAYAPLGVGSQVASVGDLPSGVAWSTMKVPVAIAVTRAQRGKPDAETSQLIRLAVTRSDNAAAERLWAKLGTPQAAAALTRDVLRSAGDDSTVVQAKRVRPAFSAFGQTEWAVDKQAQFAAALPCLEDGRGVLALMSQVDPSGRWGAGTVQSAAPLKGGWGPDPSGRYQVRQLSVLTVADGSRMGVAIAAAPADGTFKSGTAAVSAAAALFVDTVRGGGATSC